MQRPAHRAGRFAATLPTGPAPLVPAARACDIQVIGFLDCRINFCRSAFMERRLSDFLFQNLGALVARFIIRPHKINVADAESGGEMKEVTTVGLRRPRSRPLTYCCAGPRTTSARSFRASISCGLSCPVSAARPCPVCGPAATSCYGCPVGPRSNARCILSTPSRRSASTQPTQPPTIGITSITVSPSTKRRAPTRDHAIRHGFTDGGLRTDRPHGDPSDDAGDRDFRPVDDRGETRPPVSVERFRKRAHRSLPTTPRRQTCCH
jgi:hypothetical protein